MESNLISRRIKLIPNYIKNFLGNALVSILASNILMTAYRNITRWPDIFVRIYIEDAMGERVWVDHPESKYFVDNICTAFDTKLPSQHHFAAGGFFVGSGGTTGNTGKSAGKRAGLHLGEGPLEAWGLWVF